MPGLGGERRLCRGSLRSKDPNESASGPKYYNMNGIWDLKPYYLGPWTLRGYRGYIEGI